MRTINVESGCVGMTGPVAGILSDHRPAVKQGRSALHFFRRDEQDGVINGEKKMEEEEKETEPHGGLSLQLSTFLVGCWIFGWVLDIPPDSALGQAHQQAPIPYSAFRIAYSALPIQLLGTVTKSLF